MTLPTDYSTVPVHGKWTKLDGTAETGRVKFQPTIARLVDAAQATIIMGDPWLIELDASGEVSLALPATDDPDVTGTPFVYAVTVTLSDSSYGFFLAVPQDTVGTIELASLSSATVPAIPVSPYVQSINGHSGVLTSADLGSLPTSGGTLTGQLVLAPGVVSAGQTGTPAVVAGATPEKATDLLLSSGGRVLYAKTTSTYDHAATFYLTGAQTLPGTGVYNPTQHQNSALNIVSENYQMSTVQVSGAETNRGTIKVTHKGYKDGTDSNAAAISIDLQTVWNTPGDNTIPGGLTGTKARGIFVTSTTDISGTGVLGDAMVVRLTTGLDDFRITGNGKLILGSPTGTTPQARLDVRALAGNTTVNIQQPSTSGSALVIAADTGGSTSNVVSIKDNTGASAIEASYNGNLVARRNTYVVGGLQVGATSGTFGSGGLGITDTSAPGTPAGGVAIWSEAGLLKWKAPSGTVYKLDGSSALNPNPVRRNLLGYSFDPAAAVNNLAASAGVEILVRVVADASGNAGHVSFGLSNTPAGCANSFVGIRDANGNLLASSADISGTLNASSAGKLTVALTSTAAITAGSTYYVVFLIGSASTAPALARAASNSVINDGLNAGGYQSMTNGSGQTSLPASVTMTSAAQSSTAFYASMAV